MGNPLVRRASSANAADLYRCIVSFRLNLTIEGDRVKFGFSSSLIRDFLLKIQAP
jgi:hypothetical protein